MPRYIDADKLLSDELTHTLPVGCGRSSGRVVVFADDIENQPTADVVEVVRCKDCEYWKYTSFDTVTEDHWGECRKPLGYYRYCETAENDFCSYGERREV